MIYWAGGNPMHHHQDRNAMLKAWKKLETVIVHEPHWTSTARMADIILPTTTEIERNDIERIGDYSSTHFLALQKAVEPIGESKDDSESPLTPTFISCSYFELESLDLTNILSSNLLSLKVYNIPELLNFPVSYDKTFTDYGSYKV